jgi:hypothetical protein
MGRKRHLFGKKNYISNRDIIKSIRGKKNKKIKVTNHHKRKISSGSTIQSVRKHKTKIGKKDHLQPKQLDIFKKVKLSW